MHPLAATAIREIRELHGFFEAWLGGSGPSGDIAFRRAEAALASGFTMVTPSGQRLSRSEVLGWLRSAHGSRRDPAPFRISIDESVVLHCEVPLVVVSYVEVQRGAEISTRRSLAVLREAEDAPCGVLWLALQETWASPQTGASTSEPS
jgi:hypothetical protein